MSAVPQIDYSNIEQPQGTTPSKWIPPRHVYFGKRDAEGNMEQEPTYSYKPFPAMMYAQEGGKIVARLVKDEKEAANLGAEWKDSPAKLGLVTAPAFGEKGVKDAKPEKLGLPK